MRIDVKYHVLVVVANDRRFAHAPSTAAPSTAASTPAPSTAPSTASTPAASTCTCRKLTHIIYIYCDSNPALYRSLNYALI